MDDSHGSDTANARGRLRLDTVARTAEQQPAIDVVLAVTQAHRDSIGRLARRLDELDGRVRQLERDQAGEL